MRWMVKKLCYIVGVCIIESAIYIWFLNGIKVIDIVLKYQKSDATNLGISV